MGDELSLIPKPTPAVTDNSTFNEVAVVPNDMTVQVLVAVVLPTTTETR